MRPFGNLVFWIEVITLGLLSIHHCTPLPPLCLPAVQSVKVFMKKAVQSENHHQSHWDRATTVVMVAMELGWIGEADARVADILELCGYSVTDNASVRANAPVPPAPTPPLRPPLHAAARPITPQ